MGWKKTILAALKEALGSFKMIGKVQPPNEREAALFIGEMNGVTAVMAFRDGQWQFVREATEADKAAFKKVQVIQ
jgi:hypothetical protein